MIKRHRDALYSRLEEAAFSQGWTVLSEEELRLWYGQKITKTVWFDLLSKLREVEGELELEASSWKVHSYVGQVLLVQSDELRSLADLARVAGSKADNYD